MTCLKNNQSMKTFITKLIFNVQANKDGNDEEFDEQLRMINAASKQDAFYKAKALGRQEEEIFVNHQNQLITWKFIDVAEVIDLAELKDGELLCSQTLKTEDAEGYIQYVRQKSIEIQAKSLTFA